MGVAPCVATAASIKLPYAVGMTETQAANAAKNGGLTNDQIRKATRGIAQTGDVPAITVTPTACIGPDVIFNDVANSGVATGAPGTATNTARQGVALCDPNGYRPANDAAQIGTSQGGTKVTGAVPAATQTYAQNKLWYSGTIGANAAAQTNGVKLNIQKFWDPITAAQASGGAFCCDALYYGNEGLGRGSAGADPPVVEVTKNADFKPIPLVGGQMDLQVVPGGVCTDGKPTTSVKEGLSAAVNVEQEEFLEGQAFYACLAPSQYVLPKVNSVAVTQTANAAKQKKCAQTLTKMLKMNQVSAGTKPSDAKCKADALVTATTANQALATGAACTGTFERAVEYPSGWSELAVVPLLLHTLFPTDTATLTLALRTSLPLVQPQPSRVCRSSQLFRAARTWPATLPPRQTLVDAPTRLVWLRLLPGMAVRLSSLRAQRPPATPQPARLRRSKGRSGCFPQPDFLSVLAVVGVFELLQAW